jgi:malonyl-CoA O-methyltransferase
MRPEGAWIAVDHGPKGQLVQRAMRECLARIRQAGERDEAAFAQATADLPPILREVADLLGQPRPDVAGRREAPALRGYALWAAGYDGEMDNPVVLGEEDAVHRIIGEVAGLRVLDVGCGTGRHAVRLAAQGASVIGLDPTPEMLDRARAKARTLGADVDLRAGGLESLEESLGEFDLVLCCLVLSHVEDLGDAMRRLAERVRPGGRLVVSDFHPVNVLLGFRTAFTHDGQRYIVPNYLHPVGEYFAALRSVGLEVTQLHEVGEWVDLPGLPTTLLLEATRPRDRGA